jgi:hypothetical protein
MFILGGLAIAAAVFVLLMPDSKAAAVVPVPKPIEPKLLEVKADEIGKPRWHKFDILLELQECLLESGVDEKTVRAKCEELAPLLLGAKK